MKLFVSITFFAFFYYACFLTNAAESECGEHEVPAKCIPFNVTCEKPYGEADIRECVPGCICEDKYAYDPKGNCIPGPECKQFCNRNQTISRDCIPECPETCPSVNPRCILRDLQCVLACVCREGYVLNAEGNCILKEDCPK